MIGKCDSTYTALAQEPSLDPPSYFPGASTPDLQASTSGAPYPITTNQLAISHTSTPIKSVYHIDTSAVVPPHVLGPSVSADPGPSIARLFGLEGSAAEGTGAGQARPNAVFKTKSGSIDVDLHVRGGERAVILVESTYDAVKVAIAERQSGTILDLTVAGPSVRISLPRDFCGTVRGGSKHGKLAFSPALQPTSVTFAVDQENPLEGRYFIGDWNAAAAAPESGEWQGDRLTVTSKDGDVLLETWEEREAVVASLKAKWTERAGLEGWLWDVLGETGKVAIALGGVVTACFCHCGQ